MVLVDLKFLIQWLGRPHGKDNIYKKIHGGELRSCLFLTEERFSHSREAPHAKDLIYCNVI